MEHSHDIEAVERALHERGGRTYWHFGQGTAVKETHIPAGVALGKHVHDFDHASAVVRGRVRVHIEGEGWREYAAGAGVTVRAGLVHTVEAVTDAIWLCIHDADRCDEDDRTHARIDRALINARD